MVASASFSGALCAEGDASVDGVFVCLRNICRFTSKKPSSRALWEVRVVLSQERLGGEVKAEMNCVSMTPGEWSQEPLHLLVCEM